MDIPGAASDETPTPSSKQSKMLVQRRFPLANLRGLDRATHKYFGGQITYQVFRDILAWQCPKGLEVTRRDLSYHNCMCITSTYIVKALLV